MAARTTRQEARKRLFDIAAKIVDGIIPADESVPLNTRTFLDFENKAAAFNELKCAALEEQTRLSDSARCDEAGSCPHCGSENTRLKSGALGEVHAEARSPDGTVSYTEQHARCRACDGSFSPSAQRLAATRRGSADNKGV